MAIKEKHTKVLWGRAAGRCSAPNCHTDLTPQLAKGGAIVLGEMAHVIGRKPGAARSRRSVGTNDSYENLILLCPTHHTLVDKAPNDFPASRLRKWKRDWESKVKRTLLQRMSANGGNELEMRLWAYFNFDIVLKLRERMCNRPIEIPADLWTHDMVNLDGFPLEGSNELRQHETIFDTWPADKARQLQDFYAGIVDQIIDATAPVDLDEVWGLRKLRALLYPTAIVFLNRGCNFKTIRKMRDREERRVTCRSRGIALNFQIDTWNAYSNSSITLHFRGRSRIAALLLIRGVECLRNGRRSGLEIKATPVALGTGYWPTRNLTPPIAYRDDDEYEDEDDEVE